MDGEAVPGNSESLRSVSMSFWFSAWRAGDWEGGAVLGLALEPAAGVAELPAITDLAAVPEVELLAEPVATIDVPLLKALMALLYRAALRSRAARALSSGAKLMKGGSCSLGGAKVGRRGSEAAA